MAVEFKKEQLANFVGTYTAVVDEDYAARTAVVKELSEEYEVSVNVIRSRLVAEGVYKAKEKGVASEKGKSKADVVKAFEAVSGKTLKSMEKMTAKDLNELWDWVVLSSARSDADS